MSAFQALGLSDTLVKGISDLGFENPTPIQEQIIPLALESDGDIVGLAQTGTGKTAAFGLPVLEQTDTSDKTIQTLILSPTRELCIQIAKDLKSFAKYMDGLRITSVYGGERIELQLSAIKKGPQIIVATPGRVGDLIRRKAIDLSGINTLVLDEADEMLNMGFRDELDFILQQTPKEKRTLLFSATMAGEVERIAKNYLKKPQQVTIGKQNQGSDNVRHIFYQVQERDRYLALKRIADYNPDIYGIVFCRTRMETKNVAAKFIKDGYPADALHGDLNQSQRDAVMKKFRDKSIQMLVATDVAARGIDVKDITHVINYNLPEEAEIYTHRSGRTGRAGSKGVSLSIVNFRELFKIKRTEKVIGKKIEKAQIPTGEEICGRQLFSMIDRMENVEVDEHQIAPFMEAVNTKLESLSKEDIIKKFVSLEFNRFLEYYKNAPDLNDSRKGKDQQSSSGMGRNKSGDGEWGGRRGRGNGFQRFFLNLGNKDNLTPNHVIAMINKHAPVRNIRVGEIDIKDSFSFVEVSADHAETVRTSLTGKKLRDRIVKLEPAETPKDKPSGRGGHGGGDRPDSFRNKKKKKFKSGNKPKRF
jgi:ATP-dependent RNA helicase DeaD